MICHFQARAIALRRKTWLRTSRILFAAKHSRTTLPMSRPLFVGSYLQGFRPMKRKKSLRRMMNAILSTFSNMCLLLSLNQISTCCRYSRKCCWYSTTVGCVGEKARCMIVKKPRNTREREMVMAVCSSVTGSLRNRENLALNSYLYLGNWKLRAGFILGLRKQTTFRDATTGFPAHDVWETSAEIPYWWRVTTQIWVVLLIGRVAREICFNQSEAPPRSG